MIWRRKLDRGCGREGGLIKDAKEEDLDKEYEGDT